MFVLFDIEDYDFPNVLGVFSSLEIAEKNATEYLLDEHEDCNYTYTIYENSAFIMYYSYVFDEELYVAYNYIECRYYELNKRKSSNQFPYPN